MNKKVKALWLNALRNGEYKQGKKRLRSGERFCCLGVLCDLYVRQVGGRWIKDEIVIRGRREEVFLPSEVMHWAGLISRVPQIGEPLTTLNDGCSDYCNGTLNFDEIADLIQVHL